MELTPDNLEFFANTAINAAQSGNSAMLLSLALVGVVWALRKYFGKKITFLQSQEGGALLTLVSAFGGALATRAASGAPITGELLLGALKVAFMASGGWTLLKHLGSALLEKFQKVDPVAVKAAAEAEGVAAGAAAKDSGKVLSIADAIKKEGDK